MSTYHLWQKKIGEVHISRSGEPETICGRPMLGNNYAFHRGYGTLGDIPEEEKICKVCLDTYSKEDGDFPVKKTSDDLYGSIQLAEEFDRIKEKVVLVMNRIGNPTDQDFAKRIDLLLREIEHTATDWLVIFDLREENKNES